MSILDNEGHRPDGLMNQPSWNEVRLLRAEVERLRAIADQRKNKKEIAVTARNRALDGVEYWKAKAERLQAALHDAMIYIGECDPEFCEALKRKADFQQNVGDK